MGLGACNSVCSQFSESLFAILADCWEIAIVFEGLFNIEIQEEIKHFAVLGGGPKGHQKCEQKLCEQTGIS